MKRRAPKKRNPLLLLIDYLWAAGGLLMCLAWWTGWLVKDRHPTLIWLYYVPHAFMAVGGFLWLFVTLRDRFRPLQLFVFLTVIMCLIKVLVIDHRWNRPPETLPENNIRVLHWNTARGALGVDSIVQQVVDDIPDIVLISEPPRGQVMADIANHALGMKNIYAEGGMSLVSHYPINYLGTIDLPAGAGWHAVVETDYGPLEIAAIDLISRPNLDRRPAMAKLEAWLEKRTSNIPLVVLGDFNTPHDAPALKPLRKRLDLAYAKGGRGWPYTWPVPLPLFNIDHTWVSRDITVNDFILKQTRFSDHKRQVADLSFPDRRSRLTETEEP